METLCDILERIRRDDRETLLHVRPPGSEEVVRIPAREFLSRVDSVARGMAALGVGRGDRVGLVCVNRPEWHVVDFACHRLGAIVVPAFATLTGAEMAHVLEDSGCRLLVVDTGEQLEKLAGRTSGLRSLEHLVVIDPPEAIPDGLDGTRVQALGELRSRGAPDADLRGPENADSVATLIYTSGTTGPPKGVMLTHANLVANLVGVQRRTPARTDDLGLSVLPISHAYERLIDYGYLAEGAAIAYTVPEEVSRDFQAMRPTVMIGVPRLYEKLRAAVEARVQQQGVLSRWLYRWALAVGERRGRARLEGAPDRSLDRLLHPLLDRLVLAKIRRAGGGRLRLLSAGGAALDPELNWWYIAVGWDLVQGYGLTESSPVISANAPEDNRIGSVGRPLDNVEVKIDADGEILTRGPHVMKGYWRQPEATAAVFAGDWLRTGDIGELDADGYLYVTDRKKALLVTSTGKKVAPQPLENTLVRSPYLQQAMVVGEDRKFVSALLVPDLDRLRAWARQRGLPEELPALLSTEAVRGLVRSELDRLQADFAPFERVREFRLLAEPFTVERGQLTPTLKVIRAKVAQDHAELIEEMYAE